MANSGHYDDALQDEEVFINEADGLPNVHPNLTQLDYDNDDPSADPLDDLPKSIIVTNIQSEIFNDEQLKTDMENLFRAFSDEVTFQWLRSFRRLRVNYERPAAAAQARIQLHQFPFLQSCISCYFAQPVTPVSVKNLEPPAPFKQFLISPPSSPPLGWEPRPEMEPLVNHDLLAALAALAPGECHEVLPPRGQQPAIVVHTSPNTQIKP